MYCHKKYMDSQISPSPPPLPDFDNLIKSPLGVFLVVDLIGSTFISMYFCCRRMMDEPQANEAPDTELGIPRYQPQNSGSSHPVIRHIAEKISEENLMEASQSFVYDEKKVLKEWQSAVSVAYACKMSKMATFSFF